jgi:hypothetical protein
MKSRLQRRVVEEGVDELFGHEMVAAAIVDEAGFGFCVRRQAKTEQVLRVTMATRQSECCPEAKFLADSARTEFEGGRWRCVGFGDGNSGFSWETWLEGFPE